MVTSNVISEAGRQYLQFQLTSDVGPIRFRSLIDHFGSLDRVLGASMRELQRVEGIGARTAEAILRSRADGAVDREVEAAAACGLRILCWEDDDYPKPLRAIPDPPICLYVCGRIAPTDAVAIAIVGTRRCSHYAREQAVRFGELLAGAGFTVVSGLARGIDGHAHRGALQAGGRTIAVLGNGLGSVYPPEHEQLAEKIAASGAVVSELPVFTQPTGENFPRRNRIIVGLSLGVIVVEAGQRSGALITARLANEYNREVFAIPGRIDQPANTAGVNGLIREGAAKLITSLDDVLDELGSVGDVMRGDDKGRDSLWDDQEQDGAVASPAGRAVALSETERVVFAAVAEECEDTDAIAERTGLASGQLLSTLTALELKGLVRRLPGGKYVPRRG